MGTIHYAWSRHPALAVHPHGRGDNPLPGINPSPTGGSPPRAWGQCPGCRCWRSERRFTPTGVGTMPRTPDCTDVATVHPHGRGDNGSSTSEFHTSTGSPPRAWGQCVICAFERPRSAVHPHGRGDNVVVDTVPIPNAGSPPRAWGQWLSDAYLFKHSRFTPTGVGTIFSATRRCRLSTVHPHGRGDNREVTLSQHIIIGSPPRAWGQLNEPQTAVRPGRFTPTGVGTISISHRSNRPSSVHPHGRGDNI